MSLGARRSGGEAVTALNRLREDQARLRVQAMRVRLGEVSVALDRRVRTVLARRVSEAAEKDPRFRPLAEGLRRLVG